MADETTPVPVDSPEARRYNLIRRWLGIADFGLGFAFLIVLLVTGWRPTALQQIVERSGLPVSRVMAALGALEDAGCVVREGDWWVRRRTGS